MVKRKVIVCGAGGKMGREVLRAIAGADDMELAGAVDPAHAGSDVAELAGIAPGLEVAPTLAAALSAAPDAMYVVDFTAPHVVYGNVTEALEAGRRVVFGTTGLSDAQLSHLDRLARSKGLGVIHAPNFALGAVLMMRFAAEAAKHAEGIEIIELHHDQKKDAPSGTAIKTAEMIAHARREAAGNERAGEEAPGVDAAHTGTHQAEGARGALFHGIPIHSVRLQGLVAHQEVIIGLPGQTLTIRHDSLDRASFMPGVLLALRKVDDVDGLLYGLEHLL